MCVPMPFMLQYSPSNLPCPLGSNDAMHSERDVCYNSHRFLLQNKKRFDELKEKHGDPVVVVVMSWEHMCTSLSSI